MPLLRYAPLQTMTQFLPTDGSFDISALCVPTGLI
jgi:hypothetical protein